MSNLITISQQDFQAEVLEAELPVLVDFSASWCNPCKMLAPIVEDLAAEQAGRLKVVTVDADESPDLMARYGIQGVPTLLLFQDGDILARMTGYQPKSRIQAAITPHLP